MHSPFNQNKHTIKARNLLCGNNLRRGDGQLFTVVYVATIYVIFCCSCHLNQVQGTKARWQWYLWQKNTSCLITCHALRLPCFWEVKRSFKHFMHGACFIIGLYWQWQIILHDKQNCWPYHWWKVIIKRQKEVVTVFALTESGDKSTARHFTSLRVFNLFLLKLKWQFRQKSHFTQLTANTGNYVSIIKNIF